MPHLLSDTGAVAIGGWREMEGYGMDEWRVVMMQVLLQQALR